MTTLEELKKAKEAIEEQIAMLENNNLFVPTNDKELYYFIDDRGKILRDNNDSHPVDEERIKRGNFCKNKDIMLQRAKYESFYRLLWQKAYLANIGKSYDNCDFHIIKYNVAQDRIYPAAIVGEKEVGSYIFPSYESVCEAIVWARKYIEDNDLDLSKIF